jgi:hypothetical protein
VVKKFLFVAALVSLLVQVLPASASMKVFKNCMELNRIYPGGIATPGAVNVGKTTKNQPWYDRSLYLANKKSDRDNDGIACEK